MWDGIVNAKSNPDAQICIQNNGDAKFVNYDAAGGFKKVSADLKPHACTLPSLAAIEIPHVAKASMGGAN